MSFFGKVRKFFDTGGLDYEIESDDRFRWEDGTLPFTLVVTGHASLDRVITHVSVEFERYESVTDRDDNRRRSGPRVTQRIEGPFPVPAGETVRIDGELDLPDSSGLSRMLGGAFDMLATGSISFGTQDFKLQATPMVEGMKLGKSTSRRLRLASRGPIPS